MAIEPAAISASPAVTMMPAFCTAPLRPAARAKGTVSPSAIPITTSRTTALAVKWRSIWGVCGMRAGLYHARFSGAHPGCGRARTSVVIRRMFVMLLCGSAPAFAHDFWMEPSSFRPAVGSVVTIGLRVGQDFIGDPVPRDSQLIERFVVRDSASERNLGGIEGQDPAG